MKKNYQTQTVAVATAVEALMPDAVSVSLAELVGSMREGLLALAVGAGFQVMDALIAESVCALAGRRRPCGAGCAASPRWRWCCGRGGTWRWSWSRPSPVALLLLPATRGSQARARPTGRGLSPTLRSGAGCHRVSLASVMGPLVRQWHGTGLGSISVGRVMINPEWLSGRRGWSRDLREPGHAGSGGRPRTDRARLGGLIHEYELAA